ncbi:hypothetical protein AB4084_24195, partial [Lysobacter sp. 2RAB21]
MHSIDSADDYFDLRYRPGFLAQCGPGKAGIRIGSHGCFADKLRPREKPAFLRDKNESQLTAMTRSTLASELRTYS